VAALVRLQAVTTTALVAAVLERSGSMQRSRRILQALAATAKNGRQAQGIILLAVAAAAVSTVPVSVQVPQAVRVAAVQAVLTTKTESLERSTRAAAAVVPVAATEPGPMAVRALSLSGTQSEWTLNRKARNEFRTSHKRRYGLPVQGARHHSH
jgi:hypothetical protein